MIIAVKDLSVKIRFVPLFAVFQACAINEKDFTITSLEGKPIDA